MGDTVRYDIRSDTLEVLIRSEVKAAYTVVSHSGETYVAKLGADGAVVSYLIFSASRQPVVIGEALTLCRLAHTRPTERLPRWTVRDPPEPGERDTWSHGHEPDCPRSSAEIHSVATIEVEIAKVFGLTVSGRTRADGPSSAEALREDVLGPALRSAQHVKVVIDGPAYSMAYLDAVFGGLVHHGHLAPGDVSHRIEIVASGGYRFTKLAIERFMRRAALLKRDAV
jgi:hypothetical protein